MDNNDTVVVLHTASGDIAIEFFDKDAPNHVQNFIELSENGFYDKTLFHRIIPGFMIQGGDPSTKMGEATKGTWGTGGPDTMISQEFNDIKHVRGIVSMARSNDPNSAGSQFFIVHADSPFLDGQYTVFGRIITQESFETLDTIVSLETTGTTPNDWIKTEILSVDILNKSELTEILDLESPVRTSPSLSIPDNIPVDDQPYENIELGIRFMAPAGWLIQEPEKTGPQVPDVVAVTNGNTLINPAISLTVSDAANLTLEQHIDERKKTIQPAIESGELAISNEEYGELSGRETYTINAVGIFQISNSAETVQFTEVTFLDNDKLYVATLTTSDSEYETYLDQFQISLESLTILDSEMVDGQTQTDDNNNQTQTKTDDDNNNGCLIATAAYGSELSPQVQLLREIRDDTLLQTESGTAFMNTFNQIYYSFSPTIADWERENPTFKEIVKITITPLLASLAILNYVDIDSEAQMLGFGIGLVVLNIGMYFATPTIIAYRIFRK